MACRGLVQVPKVAIRRFYLQHPLASVAPSNFVSTVHSSYRRTQCRCASSESETAPQISAVPEAKERAFGRFRRTLGLAEYTKPFYRAMGVFIYEKIDSIVVSEMFREFELEDTFYSWYLLTELHVWMLLSRASQHGKEGGIVKEYLGVIMWEDVKRRMKLVVTDLPVSEVSKTLKTLSSETDYALILYDEAVCSDDKRLAEALWVRLYRTKTVDPVVLEKVVCYVRKQIQHLDSIPREQWLLKANFTWLPLKQCRI